AWAATPTGRRRRSLAPADGSTTGREAPGRTRPRGGLTAASRLPARPAGGPASTAAASHPAALGPGSTRVPPGRAGDPPRRRPAPARTAPQPCLDGTVALRPHETAIPRSGSPRGTARRALGEASVRLRRLSRGACPAIDGGRPQ